MADNKRVNFVMRDVEYKKLKVMAAAQDKSISEVVKKLTIDYVEKNYAKIIGSLEKE